MARYEIHFQMPGMSVDDSSVVQVASVLSVRTTAAALAREFGLDVAEMRVREHSTSIETNGWWLRSHHEEVLG